MNYSNEMVSSAKTAATPDRALFVSTRQRPSFCLSDLWKAPLHDFPIRDEILYQYLPLSSQMDVLEIGPGSGFTAFRLARQVRHLALLDIAADNVARLRKALRKISNIRLICADVCQPGLADQMGSRMDAVYALEVFELLPDPERCLKNLAAVLHPGGSLLFQFPNYPPPKNPGVTYFRTREELDHLLATAGFETWEVYALRLRPHARAVYNLYRLPLQYYRRLRQRSGPERPLVYDQSWAFRNQQRLEAYKIFFHGTWTAMFAFLRLGGEVFERELLGAEILNRNLLVVARR